MRLLRTEDEWMCWLRDFDIYPGTRNGLLIKGLRMPLFPCYAAWEVVDGNAAYATPAPVFRSPEQVIEMVVALYHASEHTAQVLEVTRGAGNRG